MSDLNNNENGMTADRNTRRHRRLRDAADGRSRCGAGSRACSTARSSARLWSTRSRSSTRATQVKNPVMFVVLVGSFVTLIEAIAHPGIFTWSITIWLFLTVAVRQLRRSNGGGTG